MNTKLAVRIAVPVVAVLGITAGALTAGAHADAPRQDTTRACLRVGDPADQECLKLKHLQEVHGKLVDRKTGKIREVFDALPADPAASKTGLRIPVLPDGPQAKVTDPQGDEPVVKLARF
jgi:hypothetical protein